MNKCINCGKQIKRIDGVWVHRRVPKCMTSCKAQSEKESGKE